MKIRSIVIENSPVLGKHFEVSFTNTAGITYDNVYLIGENGSGKSQLIEIIYEFSRLKSHNSSGETRQFEIEFTDTELTLLRDSINSSKNANYSMKPVDNILFIRGDSSQNISIFDSTGKYNATSKRILLNSKEDIKNLFRVIYSTSEITFTAQAISGVTNVDIDNEKVETKKSPPDLATIITQMLVDIKARDNQEDISFIEVNSALPHIDNFQKRTNRFKNAFKKIFKEGLEYAGVEDNTTPIFKKGGDSFGINHLSSGEKQIVFRGSYLLQDRGSLLGAPVLIDEPEISLHPKWQLNIMGYYKGLFSDLQSVQQSQIIITTHSPYILMDYDQEHTKLIILKRTQSGVSPIYIDDLGHLYGRPSLGEINYIAYSLPTIEYHDELFGYLHSQFMSLGQSPTEMERRDLQDVFEREYLQTRQEIHDKNMSWTREKGLVPKPTATQVTLQTFIRHKTHHPENRTMQPYHFNIQQLEDSIREMEEIISTEGYGPII